MSNLTDEQSLQLMLCFSEMHREVVMRFKSDLLTPAERAVLFSVQNHGGEMKASEIAAALNVAAPSVTSILNRMEERGYIYRISDNRDRRVVNISLTAQGKNILKECLQAIQENLAKLAEYLGPKETDVLIQLLQKTLNFYHQNK